MGYKTEINYILKASTQDESQAINSQDYVTITKTGFRTFILGSPIMIADNNWNIKGMCIIETATVTKDQTIIQARIITRFSDQESNIVSRLIQDAEKLK